MGIVAVVVAPDTRNVEVPAAFVRFVTEWPMSGTKIKKVELHRMIAEELAARGITAAPRLP